jgi:hypothetical protein
MILRGSLPVQIDKRTRKTEKKKGICIAECVPHIAGNDC